ncbi:MAG: hypothetical protein WCA49_17075 [Candidatus Sulfotelmatobacter sp.]
MKIKLDRIISIATLVALVVAIALVLKKPVPVAQPQAPAGVAANAQSFNAGSSSPNVDRPEPGARQTQPMQQSQTSGGYSAAPQLGQNSSAPQSPKAEAHSNSDGIGAAISQILGAGASGAAALSPDSDVGGGTPNIKDQKVDYDGDLVHGHFLTEIAGKDVWVTISGHMGQKDGYATFEPTEFKVGDMDVPVSLVNPALQRKLAEERDRLKLSDPAGVK